MKKPMGSGLGGCKAGQRTGGGQWAMGNNESGGIDDVPASRERMPSDTQVASDGSNL